MDKFKKYLPFIILILGVFVLVAAVITVKKRSTNTQDLSSLQEENTPEIPFDKRPFASLLPSKDGHWLKLKVENIKIQAYSLDYEILYQLPDGRTQGVPGTIKLTESSFERDILLGSESSGKYRYDEGVESGTLTLKFRDDNGKLVGKLVTDFRLLSETKELTSSDSKFKYSLDNLEKGVYFVVMETFGVLTPVNFEISSGPYAVFSSVDKKLPGKVSLGSGDVYHLENDSWKKIDGGKSPNIGIFVSASDTSQ